MNRFVIVCHQDSVTGEQIPTALVQCFAERDNSFCLERAWTCTQNIFGSWSMGEFLDVREPNSSVTRREVNEDYDRLVTPLVPLPVHNGQTYGLRSSMVGDVFVLDGRSYRVASSGFEPLDP